MLASVLVSLSVSMKSEALNIVPAFLMGLILNYGALNSLKCISSMIALQILFLAPFLSETNLLSYLETVYMSTHISK